MKFQVLTLFPDVITSYASTSILGRAQHADILSVQAVNIRDFADDKHKITDDTPYGGGAGMVMKVEPIYRALESINAIPFAATFGLAKVKRIVTGKIRPKKTRIILLSPRGRQFDQRLAEQWASDLEQLVMICGRYEGVDQRVVDHLVDEEVSVGPYVLAGGELGALAIVEAVARLIPGVLGNEESLKEETFSSSLSASEYPQYTKPSEFRGWKVPEVLLSGDHKKIEEWRRSHTG